MSDPEFLDKDFVFVQTAVQILSKPVLNPIVTYFNKRQ